MSKEAKKIFTSHGEAVRFIYHLAKKYGIELKTQADKDVIEAALEFAKLPIEEKQISLIKLLSACTMHPDSTD